MCSNIANATLVSWNLELQKTDKKPNICCKYYLSPDRLRIDVDIFALLVSIGLVHSWVSWCACYYPQAKACSALGRFCLLIYGNTHGPKVFSWEKKRLGQVPTLLRPAQLHHFHGSWWKAARLWPRLAGGFQLPRGLPVAALQPRNAAHGGAEETLSLGGVWQPVWAWGMRALRGEAPGHCPVGQRRCMKSDDSRERWTALPGGSDTRSASLFCGRRNSSLACGAQLFCMFTSTPDLLWK